MSALKQITTRAKQIRKHQPGISWKTAIKKAGAEYRTGKKSHARTRVKKAKKQKRPGVKRATINKKATGTPSPIAQLKAGLKEQLGRALLTKELSRKKTDKRKAQKRVSEIRGKLRKVQTL